MLKRLLLVVTVLSTLHSAQVLAETIEASGISSEQLHQFIQGESNDVLEFRAGDRLPVALHVSGDILESEPSEPTFLIVKRPFYLANDDGEFLLSWDGRDFRPLEERISGKLGASVSGNPVTSVLISLTALADE